MQDIITREIMVKAKKEKVYAALTDPKQLTAWFPDKIDGSLDVGQRPILIFTKYDHQTQIYVEAARPYEYFAYRWVPGSAGIMGDVLKVPNTLVEFFIEEQKDGTKITVKESGFASLPANVAEESFNENSGGWKIVMGDFEKVMNQ